MELALLTGVNIILTIYDEVDSKIIQYKSDSIEVIQEISRKKVETEENYANDDVSFTPPARLFPFFHIMTSY